MPTEIHKLAVVDDKAELGENVKVGPGCVVGPGVKIGDGCELKANVVIEKNVTLGRDNVLYPGACLGTNPQDLKFGGEVSFVEIGDRNQIRECMTIQPGVGEGEVTRVGSDNLFMAYTHIAHNCNIGSHVVLANCATIAGHVLVEDYVVIGGLTGIHQYARVGRHAMVGALSRISKDILPYSTTSGCDEVKVYGPNKVGLKRRGFSRDTIRAIDRAFKILQDTSKLSVEALAEVKKQEMNEDIEHLLNFIAGSQRGWYR